MEECKCYKCVISCKRIPGIPKPDELVRQAEFLKIPLKDYLEKYCVAGYREDLIGKGRVDFVYPARKGFGGTGETWGYPLDNGDCIFLDNNNLCMIHPVKPFECARGMACKDTPKKSYRLIALRKWKKDIDILLPEIKKFIQDKI